MPLKIRNWFIGEYLETVTDYYVRARIILNYNFLLSLSIILFSAAAFFTIMGTYPIAIENVLGGSICFAQLFFLKKFKDVTLSAKVFVIFITLLMMGNTFLNQQVLPLGAPLWMTITILFAVFNLGFRWGIWMTAITIVFFAVYILTVGKTHLLAAASFPDSIFHSVVLEFAIAFSVIFYIISVFLKTNLKAEYELRQNFLNLEKKNILITKQNQEKEVLVREIHHRVKNNMQVISSLIRLKSQELKEPESAKAFDDAQQRIIAMALIHERMYKSEELSKIEIETYIRLLALDLINQYSTTQSISLEIDIQLGYVGPKSIVPMGLILNEMICNSVIHGIEREGVIQIVGQQLEDGIELKYSDNGCGYADSSEKGFGLELIGILTEQLNGQMEVFSVIGKGSNTHFKFPALN